LQKAALGEGAGFLPAVAEGPASHTPAAIPAASPSRI
jgi:hypothetical protein